MGTTTWLIIALVLAVVSVAEHQYNRRPFAQRRADSKDLTRLSDWADGPLYFRRMIESDLDLVTEAASDPLTMQANRAADLDAAQIRESYQPALEAHFLLVMVGVEHATDTAVGWTILQDSPVEPESAISLGLVLRPDFRGKGYGRQLLGAAIASQRGRFLRRPRSLEVFVGTAVDNHAMQRIMSQLGYEAEPATSPYHAPNGEVVESLWYRCGPTTAEPKLR